MALSFLLCTTGTKAAIWNGNSLCATFGSWIKNFTRFSTTDSSIKKMTRHLYSPSKKGISIPKPGLRFGFLSFGGKALCSNEKSVLCNRLSAINRRLLPARLQVSSLSGPPDTVRRAHDAPSHESGGPADFVHGYGPAQ